MITHRQLIRRDQCALLGERASRLNDAQAARAWHSLAVSLDLLGDKDIPKYRDLFNAIRSATINAKQKGSATLPSAFSLQPSALQ